MITSLIVGVFLGGNVSPTVVDGRWSFGTAKVGNETVALSFPGCGLEPPAGNVIAKGTWRYVAQSDGTLSLARGGDGGWGEFAGPLSRLTANPNALKWRAKVFIFTRSELLSNPGPGDYRFRRGRIESYMLGPIKESLARLGAIVRAKTDGRVDVEFDVETDDDPELATVTNDRSDAYGQSFIDRVLGPRVNSTDFVTDDGIYRGPYHSIFYIHPGRVESFPLGELKGMPVSGISYFTRPVLSDPDRLTLTLWGSWIRQLSARVRQAGYASPAVATSFENPFALSPDQYATQAMWPTILAMKPVPPADEVSRRFRPEALANASWSDVADDPFGKLPRLSLERGLNTDSVTSILNGGTQTALLSFGASNGGAETTWIVTPLSKASVVGPLLQQNRSAKTIGFLEGSIQNAIVFAVPGAIPGGLELNALATAGSVQQALVNPAEQGVRKVGSDFVFVGKPVQSSPEIGPAADLYESIRTEGEIRGEKVQENFEITERGFFRSGEVNLYQANDGGFEIAGRPVINLGFRQSGKDIFALQIDFVPRGRGYLVLGEAPFLPVGAVRRDEPWLAVRRGADNEWNPIRVDLSELCKEIGSTRIRRIAVTPLPYYEYQERQQTAANNVSITKIGFEPLGGTLTSVIRELEPTVSTKWSDLANVTETPTEAQRDLIRGAMADENRRVRLAALKALTKASMLDILPSVEAELKSPSAWSAMFAAQALAAWNTPDANAMLKRGLEIGPFDHTRMAVAEAIANRKGEDWANSISLLYASRSWRTREVAVETLGRLGSREAALIGVSFLRDAEPSVRLAFVRTADTANELVARRMVFTAVNDPSEEVRATAAIRILESNLPEFRGEALRVSREDSAYVRMRVLNAFSSRPASDQRQFIAQSLLDPVPAVRAAAVRALQRQEKVASADEWTSLRNEESPQVLLAIGEYCVVRKYDLGAALKSKMAACPDPEVRKVIKGLQ